MLPRKKGRSCLPVPQTAANRCKATLVGGAFAAEALARSALPQPQPSSSTLPPRPALVASATASRAASRGKRLPAWITAQAIAVHWMRAVHTAHAIQHAGMKCKPSMGCSLPATGVSGQVASRPRQQQTTHSLVWLASPVKGVTVPSMISLATLSSTASRLSAGVGSAAPTY